MDIILIILSVIFFTFILNTLINWSNNIIFIAFKKPNIWIIFMSLLSFFYFLIGSQISNSHVSFNVIWWSAFLALMANISDKPSEKLGKLNDKDMEEVDNYSKKLVDKIYNDLGIKKGRLKQKLGLFAYIIGGLLGWLLFF